jgi:alkaline phosphatase D
MRVLLFLVLLAAATAGCAQTIVRGPIVSAVTDSSARIIVQLDGPASISIECSEHEDFSAPLFRSSIGNALAIDRYFVTLEVQGLAPSTKYVLRSVINAVTHSLTPSRSFRTYPKRGNDVPFTFLFGSCSRYDSTTRPSGVFKLMQQDDPLLFLHIGDWDYPDYEVSQYFTDHDSTIAKAYERKYLTGGGLDTLLMNCPVDYVYDDHDYIGNNSDGTWRTRDNAVAGYRKYFPHYELPNPTGGIWHKFSAGNVDVFMLDLRSARSIDTNAYQFKDSAYVWEAKPGQSMLRGIVKGNEDQLAWFLRELKASTARWKFIMSSVNWNPSVRKQLPLALAQANATKNSSTLRTLSDTWLGFTEEQDSIIAYIKREGIANIIFCSGDVHTAMMDDGTNAVFPEIVSANLQNYNSNVYGTLKNLGLADQIWGRGGQVKDSLRTYGRITIKTTPKHSALLEIVDELGKIVGSYEVADSTPTTGVDKFISEISEVRLKLVSEQEKANMYCLSLPKKSMVRAYLVDTMGRIVSEILRGQFPDGESNFPVRKGVLSSGVYQLIVEVDSIKVQQSITVLK